MAAAKESTALRRRSNPRSDIRNRAIVCHRALGGVVRTLDFTELLSRLQSCYCGTVAIDGAHLPAGDQRRWLYTQFENRYGTAPLIDREARPVAPATPGGSGARR